MRWSPLLLGGLVLGLAYGLFFWLWQGLSFSDALGYGLRAGLVAGLAIRLSYWLRWRSASPASRLDWSWSNARPHLHCAALRAIVIL